MKCLRSLLVCVPVLRGGWGLVRTAGTTCTELSFHLVGSLSLHTQLSVFLVENVTP